MNTAKGFGWVTAVAGVWEIVAPFILGYSASTGALVDALVLGIVLVGFGLWTALSHTEITIQSLSWIDELFGAWLIAAPFIVVYSSNVAATVNDIIVGAVVLVVEVWGALAVGTGKGAALRQKHA